MASPNLPGDAAPKKRSLRSGNPCKGCGTQIAPGESYCTACQERRPANPSMVLNPQKRPPYETRDTRNQ